MLERMRRNWITHILLVGIYRYSGIATPEKSLAVSKKKTDWLNVQLSYNPTTALLSIHPREMATYFTQNLYTNVSNSFVLNCQKLETAQSSFNRWMVKLTRYSHPMEFYPAIKRNDYWYTQWMNLHKLRWMKKANPKRLHTVWFYLYLKRFNWKHLIARKGHLGKVERVLGEEVGTGVWRQLCPKLTLWLWVM